MPDPIQGVELIKFLKPYRCFQAGDEFTFRPGLNLLVGDQGSGKSSLLQILLDAKAYHGKIVDIQADSATEVRSFDFEKDNPRKLPVGGRDGKLSAAAQMAMKLSSHGETNRAVLRAVEDVERTIVLMDEPDACLSIRSCRDLCRLFDRLAANGCQVIASVHNPVVIDHVDLVLSLEHRRWMTPLEFVGLMHEPREEPAP